MHDFSQAYYFKRIAPWYYSIHVHVGLHSKNNVWREQVNIACRVDDDFKITVLIVIKVLWKACIYKSKVTNHNDQLCLLAASL